MSGYTIIDFETTGLFPTKHDRVVEVGVVYVSERGEIQGEWGTLVDPQRDVGPTSIHGISARDVLGAPTFQDLAPHLLRAISGRTIVAHNARFDLQFLDHELTLAGIAFTPPSPGLCTMEWSNAFIGGASRRLADCCATAGVPHAKAHSALGDARAVAGLLNFYLSRSGMPTPWHHVYTRCSSHAWPVHLGDLPTVTMVNRPAAPLRPDAWLQRITSHVPRNDDPVIEAYLDVLEHAMLDRYLSSHEEEALVEMATNLGLHRDQLAAVHATYLDALAVAALADGVVTDAEMAELMSVAGMLGLPRALVALALKRAEPIAGRVSAGPVLTLEPGDRVVFTGELSLPRDEWVARAASFGLEHGGVTKRTKLVVAGDPDSQSGKAAKARSYNVPVITEAAFMRMLAVMTGVLVD